MHNIPKIIQSVRIILINLAKYFAILRDNVPKQNDAQPAKKEIAHIVN